MTDHSPTPPQTPASPPRKGLHPLAWVAIGCGGLLLVGAVLFSVVGYFAARKVKEVANDLQERPVTTMARAYALAHPELELVAADEEERVVTLRNKSTGEEATFDASEIEQGRIEFRDGKGGVARFGPGPDSGGDVPDWIPRYPDATYSSSFSMELEDGHSETLTMTTDDSPSEVLAFYERELGSEGWEIQENAGVDGQSLLALQEQRNLTITVVRQEGQTQASLSYFAAK